MLHSDSSHGTVSVCPHSARPGGPDPSVAMTFTLSRGPGSSIRSTRAPECSNQLASCSQTGRLLMSYSGFTQLTDGVETSCRIMSTAEGSGVDFMLKSVTTTRTKRNRLWRLAERGRRVAVSGRFATVSQAHIDGRFRMHKRMLHVDPVTGLVNDASYCPSPNCDERPAGVAPDLLVVHSISLPPGRYGGRYIRDFFQNRLDVSRHAYFEQISDLRVSAHVLIERNGQLTQFVPFHRRAWHAGESTFGDRTRCNDFSIGIELEGTDTTPFRTVQYWKLAHLVQALRTAYSSMAECPVVGHSDIAPGRKTDPGSAFDWNRLHSQLDGLSVMYA